MTRRARERVRRNDWQNVHVVCADAARPGIEPETFDAAYAAMSISAMPEPSAALATARSVFRPGGRLVVLVPRDEPALHVPDGELEVLASDARAWVAVRPA
jgi:demethylmenaquinone methyltransferase/2-methoxy-6-polyprenyl-1,4-benzoquinol methylase